MSSGTVQLLSLVWAETASDAWAASDLVVLHWDGVSWSPTVSVPDAVSHSYSALCGISASDVFLVDGGVVYRGNASAASWTVAASDASVSWASVACRPGKAWIVGLGASGTHVAHWDGTGFVDEDISNQLTTSAYNQIWLSSDDTVYITGEAARRLPKRSTLGGPYGDAGAYGVRACGTSSSDVVLTDASDLSVKHYNGATWTDLVHGTDVPVASGQQIGCGSAAGRTVLVGDRGTVMVCDSMTCAPTLTDTFETLSGVWAIDDKHAFIVGNDGTILY